MLQPIKKIEIIVSTTPQASMHYLTKYKIGLRLVRRPHKRVCLQDVLLL